MKGYTQATAKEIRDNFADLAGRTAYGGERIVITRHGKEFVALISIEDMRLLEELEDYVDNMKADAAIRDSEGKRTIPLSEVKEKFRVK